MLRVVLVNLALFIAPFLLYWIWLKFSQNSNHPERWSKGPIAYLTLCGVVLVVVSFVAMATPFKSPEGSNYIPSQMRDGVFVPGYYE